MMNVIITQAAAAAVAVVTLLTTLPHETSAKLADRGRFEEAAKKRQSIPTNSRRRMVAKPPPRNALPIEGPKYRATRKHIHGDFFNKENDEKIASSSSSVGGARSLSDATTSTPRNIGGGGVRGGGGAREAAHDTSSVSSPRPGPEQFRRQLSSQLTGCCHNYQSYSAMDMCALYGNDCESGEQPSHDSGDDDCTQAGLSFIGVSFSVNTAKGNPYSYQLCDQFPMENLIDRNYDYVMSMDEDGWLVGGGYKSFDYSGKMPYIDSSHTELLRIGSLDTSYGGTSIEQVYSAMESVSFPPFAIYPEFVKGGGGGGSGDGDGVPSSDVTLIVSVVDSYSDYDSYSTYDDFLDSLFDAMDAVGGGACMDDHDTDPHVSMARGVKYKSLTHQQQYFFQSNLEVAVWQAMYPKGVVIGSSSYASFPLESKATKEYVGYGNLYFFFDRANITKAFHPNRDLSDKEVMYATIYSSGNAGSYYEETTTIDFEYNGSGSKDNSDQEYYEHNPYGWDARMAKHDMTDGWDLPPGCEMEGETFIGIPLSRSSDSKLQSTSSFQDQFDFEYLLDRNFTYIKKFGTNHGWLVGEEIGNGAGSIVDKDTAHIPIFYTGTINADMGGIDVKYLVKILKKIDFGTLYIKPAFVFQDDDGSIKLQFEADANSALGYLYNSLCQMLGISWNYESPYNDLGVYSNCAMHAAGDRAKYGCGPDNTNSGGFCPQLTLAYRVGFQSEDHAAAYLQKCNNYVDYWRSLYPTGVAVGTSKFCPEGGCIALFLQRHDPLYVFSPDLGGSWVTFMGGTSAPTISPAPTYEGGCDNPNNSHSDKCFRKKHARKASADAWGALGAIGQLSMFLLFFMATTLSISLFLAKARRMKNDGESYLDFLIRDLQGDPNKKRKKKKLRKKVGKRGVLDKDLLEDEPPEQYNKTRTVPARLGKLALANKKKSKRHSSAATIDSDATPRASSSSRTPRASSKGPRRRPNSGDKSKRSRSKQRSEVLADPTKDANGDARRQLV